MCLLLDMYPNPNMFSDNFHWIQALPKQQTPLILVKFYRHM